MRAPEGDRYRLSSLTKREVKDIRRPMAPIVYLKPGIKPWFFDFFENLWYNIYTMKKKGKDVYAD
jgi:hypothetical protein